MGCVCQVQLRWVWASYRSVTHQNSTTKFQTRKQNSPIWGSTDQGTENVALTPKGLPKSPLLSRDTLSRCPRRCGVDTPCQVEPWGWGAEVLRLILQQVHTFSSRRNSSLTSVEIHANKGLQLLPPQTQPASFVNTNFQAHRGPMSHELLC